MYSRNNFVILCAVFLLTACATAGSDYSVSKQTEADDQLASTGTQVYGHWMPNGELVITVFTLVPSGSILPTESLNADVSDDIIHVYFSIEAEKSAKESPVATLCADPVKLNYRLHGIRHIAYRIQVGVTEFGDSGSWDIQPLPLR
jgi:hypothetical protein